MITALLLAAAVPTAVDAERAFARDAQRIGQWTAFRKYADTDAVMFTPQAVWARDFLKGRKDPARSVRWRPSASFVSCDGRTAINTGPAFTPEGKAYGTFTTVWQRSGRNWRWVYDAGGPVEGTPTLEGRATVRNAACRGRATGAPVSAPPPLTARQARTTPQDNGQGQSADRTLGWDWVVAKDGSRRFRTFLWNGAIYEQVVYQQVAAP